MAPQDVSLMEVKQIVVDTTRSQHDFEKGHGEIGPADATEMGAFGQAAAAGGKQYRVLGRWKAGFVFIHTEVGIGILSLPSVLKTLGLIPGLIAILGIGLLATYTAYVYLQFWRKHRHIDNVVDALRVLGGKPLAIVGGVALIINLSFACASSVLTMSIALNTLTGHSMCTVAFVGFAALVCYILCMPRSMNFVSYFSAPATLAIIIPILIVIGSLVKGKPQLAPEVWSPEIKLVGNPSFRSAFSAILSIFYAFGGRQGFLTIAAEMKDPHKDYVPALIILQTFAIPMYLITGGAIYGLAGQYVTSPALGSAPLIPAKAAYGILMVTLFNTGLFYSHAGVKYLYIVVMRDLLNIPGEMTTNAVRPWSIWVGLATFFWAFVFILANAIPSFNNIIGVSSALLVGWFSFGIPGIFWLHMNWSRQWVSWRSASVAVLSYLLILLAFLLNSAGMWASISSLVKIFNSSESTVRGPFTCADNSLF
ncbi:hypothetical protein LTR56_015919 [Elasticomyces elasticus]|nr:hypothetical protein LTR56_015919 [Elasticomyces elasticus]KAK3655324.1 hypothetical protein LTR22_010354 [Elasticomyces elasticus]KAK4918680.1 hypothetical protein LTR49_013605 [Elasticomyces elasticus]KAK5751972.1 hypothetical protein LTS12_017988 [Elasticomyces elasticus]